MKAAASGIIDAMRDIMPTTGTGSEWHDIPLDIFAFGGGGINLCGTLCGIPNGCCSMLNLMGLHGILGSEVIDYYSTTLFPTNHVREVYDLGGWTPAHVPIPDDEVVAHTTASSPFCHISVSKWLRAAGDGEGGGMNIRAKDHPDWDNGPHSTTLKQDRCSKVAAACLRRTAELINEYVTVGYTQPDFHAGRPYKDCLDCHSFVGGTRDPLRQREDVVGQMDCLTCHNDQMGRYMTNAAITILDIWMSDSPAETAEAKWQFSPGDPMYAHVVFTCNQGQGGKAITTAGSWIGVQMTSAPIAFQAVNLQDGAVEAGAHHWVYPAPGDPVLNCPSGALIGGKGRLRLGLKAYDDPGSPFPDDQELKQADFYIVS
jgi:hypothetical protein